MTARAILVSLTTATALMLAAAAGDTVRADGPAESWRSSWSEFARVFESFAGSSREIPRADFAAIRTGAHVPGSIEVMRRFGGPVTFDGVLKGVETRNLLDGRFAKLKIDMARPRWRWRVHVYPKADAFPAWTALAPETPVTFQATVTGIARMPPDGLFEDNGYVVLLEDATPVPSPHQTFALAQAKWLAGRLGSYEYTFKLSCYCPPELQKPVTFRVTEGRSAQITATDEATRRTMERYNTIDKLFAMMRDAIVDRPLSMTSTYDDATGVPQTMALTRRGAIVDETVSFSVTGFRVIGR